MMIREMHMTLPMLAEQPSFVTATDTFSDLLKVGTGMRELVGSDVTSW